MTGLKAPTNCGDGGGGGGGGGGGSHFLTCEDLGRMFDKLFLACALFYFIFLVEISLRTLIPLFTPGLVHSGSAS